MCNDVACIPDELYKYIIMCRTHSTYVTAVMKSYQEPLKPEHTTQFLFQLRGSVGVRIQLREARQHKTTQDTPRHMTQQDKVQDQSLHNTRQDDTSSLPCGPRIAEEKESGFPALSRFKSAEAGEYTGGSVVGADAEERRT